MLNPGFLGVERAFLISADMKILWLKPGFLGAEQHLVFDLLLHFASQHKRFLACAFACCNFDSKKISYFRFDLQQRLKQSLLGL